MPFMLSGLNYISGYKDDVQRSIERMLEYVTEVFIEESVLSAIGDDYPMYRFAADRFERSRYLRSGNSHFLRELSREGFVDNRVVRRFQNFWQELDHDGLRMRARSDGFIVERLERLIHEFMPGLRGEDILRLIERVKAEKAPMGSSKELSKPRIVKLRKIRTVGGSEQ